MTEKLQRPLDLLNRSKNKRATIVLRDGSQFSGILIAFDIHINVVLEDASQVEGGEHVTKFGQMFFRGDDVSYISPSNI